MTTATEQSTTDRRALLSAQCAAVAACMNKASDLIDQGDDTNAAERMAAAFSVMDRLRASANGRG